MPVLLPVVEPPVLVLLPLDVAVLLDVALLDVVLLVAAELVAVLPVSAVVLEVPFVPVNVDRGSYTV